MVAVLIVNPAAGRGAALQARLPGLVGMLGQGGYEARVLVTTGAGGSAQELAASCLEAELVIACGGDGTVHGVVQGLAGTGVAMGVLPGGTANALARNLGLAMDPLVALERLLTFVPREIPLGEIVCGEGRRYFVVMAGCGPDGALARGVSGTGKTRLGRLAYYGDAARMFVSRRWPVFGVEYRVAGSEAWQSARATALLASRVPDLGGVFSRLTPGARMTHAHLHVQLLGTPAHVSFAAWFAASQAGLKRFNPWLTTIDAEEVRCAPLSARPVYAQADAEPLGALPVSLRMARATLRLLMPVD